jgi:hypothetical protein
LDQYHVTKQGDHWASTKAGASRASVVAPTQQGVYDAQRDKSAAGPGAEIHIHGVDGRVRAKNTIAPAKDPRKSKG